VQTRGFCATVTPSDMSAAGQLHDDGLGNEVHRLLPTGSCFPFYPGEGFVVYSAYMGEHYVGTSGFSYKDWVGHFYPHDLKKDDFLHYYSTRFGFVELNFTYYRQPKAQMLEKMQRKVHENFLFTVKAHQSITHEREAGWQTAVKEFSQGIQPLIESGQCGGVLLQFPYSFHYTPVNRLYLADSTAALQENLADTALLVEFRNREWENPKVFDEMKSRGLGLIITDHPDLKNLPQTSNMVTATTAYIRFHGRNRENWWSGDNVSRYDYLYSRAELDERLPDIISMKDSSTRLFVAFNNHHKGQAAQNALLFTELMENI